MYTGRPRIRVAIPVAAKPIGAEDAAELTQDAIAHAGAMLHRAEAAGKKVAASTVAYFCRQISALWPEEHWLQRH